MNYQRHTQLHSRGQARPRVAPAATYSPFAYTAAPQRTRARQTNLRKFVAICVVFAVLGFTFALWPHSGTPTTGQPVVSEQEPEPEPIPSLDFTAMSAKINALIQQNPGMDVGVSVVDIKTGDRQTYGVEEPFVAASTAKLLTAIAYYHEVEKGNLTLDQIVSGRSAESAIEVMIVDSDNEAWHALNNVAMSHTELAEYANQIGFSGYDPDGNTVVPSSLATMLNNLYQRRLLSEDHTTRLLGYMQRAKEVEYITSIVPAGVKVYHKPGYLADRVHDALIVDNDSRPYVLVVFTKSRTAGYDGAAGVALFQGVAQATFETFLQ